MNGPHFPYNSQGFYPPPGGYPFPGPSLPEKRSNSGLIAVICALVIAIVGLGGAGGYYLYTSSRHQNHQNVSSPTHTPSLSSPLSTLPQESSPIPPRTSEPEEHFPREPEEQSPSSFDPCHVSPRILSRAGYTDIHLDPSFDGRKFTSNIGLTRAIHTVCHYLYDKSSSYGKHIHLLIGTFERNKYDELYHIFRHNNDVNRDVRLRKIRGLVGGFSVENGYVTTMICSYGIALFHLDGHAYARFSETNINHVEILMQELIRSS